VEAEQHKSNSLQGHTLKECAGFSQIWLKEML